MINITASGVTTATGNVVTYEMVEELTKRYCTGAVVQPIVTKAWKVAETEVVGTTLYAKMVCVVNVAYYPKGSSRMVTDTFVEEFWESWGGATSASTISFVDADGVTEQANTSQTCCCTAKGVRNVGTLTFTFTAG